MKIIVPAKRPVNPYRVGLFATVAACWVLAAGLDALFITLSVVNPGDARWWWGFVASLWSLGLLVGTGAIAGWVIEQLSIKADTWKPKVSDQ